MTNVFRYCFIIVCLVLASGMALEARSKDPNEPSLEEVKGKLSKMRVNWIQNEGQANSSTLFYCNTQAGSVSATDKNTLLYQMVRDRLHVFSFEESFVGAQTNTPCAIHPAVAKVNCLTGKDRSKWKRNLPTFETLSFGEPWKDIHVEVNAYGNNIEKIFTVVAGANPALIDIQIKEATSIRIKQNGELQIKCSGGKMRFTRPVAWQVIGGQRMDVQVSYVITSKNTYGFKLGSYNQRYELIIDPLIASTYLGGTKFENDATIILDKDKNVVVMGWTSSYDFPVTNGSKLGSFYSLAVISKFDPSLSVLLSSSYIWEHGNAAMALDKNGNLIVAGNTQSNNFPATALAYDTSFSGGGSDGFVAIFTPDLSNILYATYFGGPTNEFITRIATDGSGNIFITGMSGGRIPRVISGYDTINGGSEDIIVAKFSPDLSSLLGFTYLGGSKEEWGSDIHINGKNEVYVCAYTVSPDMPVSANCFMKKQGSGGDIYLAKLDGDLTTVIAATYLGGWLNEFPIAFQFTTSGDVVIAANTSSNNYPTTTGCFRRYQPGLCDIAISRLSSDLSALMASTYIGGDWNDICTGLALDSADNVIISGVTTSQNYPTLYGEGNKTIAGTTDIAISKLNNDLSALMQSFYFGGQDEEGYFLTQSNDMTNTIGHDLCLVLQGSDIYVTGYTKSVDFPVSDFAYARGFEGVRDLFVSKFGLLVFINLTKDTLKACKDEAFEIAARRTGVKYFWSNGLTGKSFLIKATKSQWFVCSIVGTDTVWIDSVYMDVSPLSGRIKNVTEVDFCKGDSVKLSSSNANAFGYKWNTSATTKEIITSEGGVYSVVSMDSIHCMYSDWFNVTKQIPIPLNLNPSMILCENATLEVYKNIYTHYLWNTGETNSGIKIHASGLYSVKADNGICSVSDSTNITMIPAPVLHLPKDTIVCFDQLKSIILDAGEWKSYNWYPTGQHTRKIEAYYPEYYIVVVTDSNSCEGSDTALVESECHYGIYLPNAFTVNGDSLNDVLYIRGDNIAEVDLRIYNRTGREVFRTTDITVGWNGTFNNQPCMLGTYFYEMRYRLKNERKLKLKIGTITLLE